MKNLIYLILLNTLTCLSQKKVDKVDPIKINYYDEISPFFNGYARVSITKASGRYFGFIDKKGKEIIPCIYEEFYEFEKTNRFVDNYDLVALKQDKHVGIYEILTKKEIIPAKYDEISGYLGYYVAKNRNSEYLSKGTYIFNHKGENVFNTDFGDAIIINKNRFAVGINKKWKIIDSTGKLINELKHEVKRYLGEDCLLIERGDFKGMINLQGEVIVEPKYWHINSFNEGLAFVDEFNTHNIGFIDKNGNEIIPIKYPEGITRSFQEGLTCIPLKDKKGKPTGFGYIDKNEKVVINGWFYEAYNFSEGIASISTCGSHTSGYINREGKLLFRFNRPHTFSEGLAQVEIDGFPAFIDKLGNVVLKTDVSTIPKE